MSEKRNYWCYIGNTLLAVTCDYMSCITFSYNFREKQTKMEKREPPPLDPEMLHNSFAFYVLAPPFPPPPPPPPPKEELSSSEHSRNESGSLCTRRLCKRKGHDYTGKDKGELSQCVGDKQSPSLSHSGCPTGVNHLRALLWGIHCYSTVTLGIPDQRILCSS